MHPLCAKTAKTAAFAGILAETGRKWNMFLIICIFMNLVLCRQTATAQVLELRTTLGKKGKD